MATDAEMDTMAMVITLMIGMVNGMNGPENGTGKMMCPRRSPHANIFGTRNDAHAREPLTVIRAVIAFSWRRCRWSRPRPHRVAYPIGTP